MHESHPKIVARLRRAEGHLRAVIAMIEAEKPCLELAQQLHAVEAAVAKAKKDNPAVPVLLLVNREGDVRFVALKFAKDKAK